MAEREPSESKKTTIASQEFLAKAGKEASNIFKFLAGFTVLAAAIKLLLPEALIAAAASSPLSPYIAAIGAGYLLYDKFKSPTEKNPK